MQFWQILINVTLPLISFIVPDDIEEYQKSWFSSQEVKYETQQNYEAMPNRKTAANAKGVKLLEVRNAEKDRDD